jgi:hypothetical protein
MICIFLVCCNELHFFYVFDVLENAQILKRFCSRFLGVCVYTIFFIMVIESNFTSY